MNKVYVYESCQPIVKVTNKLTQVLQTIKIPYIDSVNTIFQDFSGFCWKYIGEFDEGYISNPKFFSVKFSGNYFEKNAQLLNRTFPTENDCLTIKLDNCRNVFFLAQRCDNSVEVLVKGCNTKFSNTSINFSYQIGQICGIYNPNGDDFCVKLVEYTDSNDTDLVIVTPSWKNYNCENCPTYKKYNSDSCNTSNSGITIYDYVKNVTYSATTSASLSDGSCYNIISYEGIKIVNGYDTPNSLIYQNFSTCQNCLLNFYKYK